MAILYLPGAARGLVAFVLLGLSASASAERLDVRVNNDKGKGVANAVVTLVREDNQSVSRPTPDNVAVAQEGQQFVPRVTVVPVNSWVNFPNRDPIRHHVYSFSPAKRFEIKLFKGDEAEPVQFDKPGLVSVGCNIHDWMSGYIYVTDAPLFATTNEDGELHVDNLQAGHYRVTVWHPDLKTEPTVTTLNIVKAETFEATVEVQPNPQAPRQNSLTARFRATAAR